MDKILQMLRLQQQLNDATNGEGWEKGTTKNEYEINFKTRSYQTIKKEEALGCN